MIGNIFEYSAYAIAGASVLVKILEQVEQAIEARGAPNPAVIKSIKLLGSAITILNVLAVNRLPDTKNFKLKNEIP